MVIRFLTLAILFFFQMQAHKPRASIITSLYNGDDHIAGFLSDITRQTIFDDCELIIINANSPGNEEPLIAEYIKKFPNIIYKRLAHDPGLYAVWNQAIKIAQADFITNANVDDRRNPVSLETQVQALENNASIDLVYSDFYVTFVPNETFEYNTHQYSIQPDEFSPAVMYKCITGPQPMWRKDVHERFGYFDESFTTGGDFEMWNRAVSLGANFKKIPGLSGLYYFNPRGLSTDKEKQAIQQQELYRVNETYSFQWIAHYHYYCTACDENYFFALLNLIGSIHKTSFDNLGEIAVFDLGLTEQQINLLNTIKKVSVHKIDVTHPDLLMRFKTNNAGKMVPGWYAWKFIILKQALDLFPYAIWVDAGTTILKPLDYLFKYIQQSGYFLCTMGDERFHKVLAHPIKWGTTKYVRHKFQLSQQEVSWILEQEPLLSGLIGVSRKSLSYLVRPLYNFTNELCLFADDGSASQGFGSARHDQTILSIFAYMHGLTIFKQDHTQKRPIHLPLESQDEELFITWHSSFVNDKTHIYNSRYDLSKFEYFKEYIHYK